MKWKSTFLTVGLAIAKTMVPGVAGVEAAITAAKSGSDKHHVVKELVKNGLIASEALGGFDWDDAEFNEGVDLCIQGQVKILNAVKRHQPAAPPG